MREIKFRAWDKSKNKMCNVDFIKFSKVQYTQITFSNIEENKIVYQDSSLLNEKMFGTCVLMQYTGLDDVNGIEIYEGDILKSVDCGIGEVEFYEGVWYVAGEIQNGLYDVEKCNEIEVIGNIYENEELLEDEQNG